MADKPFGVRQLNIVGAAGTPTIESAAALRIGGQQVAITTNTSVAGVVTATSFVGDGSNLTGVPVPANLTATTLDVTGISTFNDNVRVAGIVTANSLLISNDGGNNGSLFIQDTGSYSELTFRASNGTNQSKIQGVESNLYIYSGSAGHVSLGAYSIFYPNGNVTLNNGNTGTTLIGNEVHVQSGITSFYNNVSVGGTVTVTSGDVNVGVDTSTGVVLTSPNGTQYRLIVDDSGNLSTTLV